MNIFLVLIMILDLSILTYSRKLDLTPDFCGHFRNSDISKSELTSIQEFPWVATLIYKNLKSNQEVGGHSCAAVLINYIYVVTAAHCVLGDVQDIYGTVFKVKLGVWDLLNDKVGDKVIENKVSEIIVHRGFLDEDNGTHASHRMHNIALLRLTDRVKFTEYIQPICLPTRNENLNTNDTAILSGWGVNYPKTKQINIEKLKHDMRIVDQTTCLNDYLGIYEARVLNNQICAKDLNGASCFGIGGEPLMKYNEQNQRWYLHGIVSHGPGNDLCDKVPDVYMRISMYYKWIQENMRE